MNIPDRRTVAAAPVAAGPPFASPHDSSNRRPDQAGRLAAAQQFLYGRIDYERLRSPSRRYPFRLQRMRRLLLAMDSPEAGLAIVHVGGTKGKGSVSTMVAAMLTAGGYRTGLYTSPHLTCLEERFRIDNAPCSPERLLELVDAVQRAERQIEAQGQGPATFFELTTAMALHHFRISGCTAVVLEVGLGGRLDSTNVCLPRVAAITSVGLDHQHILGETIPEIAVEKAGIIKPGVRVVSGVLDPQAAEIVRRTADDAGAPLWQLGRDFHVSSRPLPGDRWGSQVDYHGSDPPIRRRQAWTVPLEGEHQARNAGVAMAILDALADEGLPVAPQQQRGGLAAVTCEARVERFATRPDVILDAAHNPDSIAALGDCLRRRRRGRTTAIVFGTSQDKDAAAMLRCLTPHADHLVLTRFAGNPRWRDPAELARLVPRDEPAGRIVQHDAAAALQQARQLVGPAGLVVVCGSFFLAAEMRPILTADVAASAAAAGP